MEERPNLPESITNTTLVAYRSVGIGLFGACMRFAGMPLEKIALYMNSSQVSGKNPFGQAVRLTFPGMNLLAPYRVVGPASLTAWFLQYSVMGVAFQFVDQTLSSVMNVRPMYYGKELMEEPSKETATTTPSQKARFVLKTALAPVIAAALESQVSNRAEVQRYFGPAKFHALEGQWTRAARLSGPAFGANCARNVIMCQTSFVLTPLTYRAFVPQESKSVSTLFWYGLGMNIFCGNVLAITQQALWGRSLDYLEQHGRIKYSSIIQHGLRTEGTAAFFTAPKWFSRVLMNAPAQGTLPWFYNEVLPRGEGAVLRLVQKAVYEPFLRKANEIETEQPRQRFQANSPR